MRHRCYPGCDLWGLCHCGARCGRKTRPARYNDPNRGWVAGQPLLCVPSHTLASSRVLPTAPLRAQLQLALPSFTEQADDPNSRHLLKGIARGGKRLMCDLYAARYGVSTRTAERDLLAIERNVWVRDDLADRWAIFLELHPVLLWPEWIEAA